MISVLETSIDIDPMKSFYQGIEIMNNHYITCYATHINALNETIAKKAEKIINDEKTRELKEYWLTMEGKTSAERMLDYQSNRQFNEYWLNKEGKTSD
jgi:flagellar biosynthesis chaperone FliJ